MCWNVLYNVYLWSFFLFSLLLWIHISEDAKYTFTMFHFYSNYLIITGHRLCSRFNQEGFERRSLWMQLSNLHNYWSNVEDEIKRWPGLWLVRHFLLPYQVYKWSASLEWVVNLLTLCGTEGFKIAVKIWRGKIFCCDKLWDRVCDYL